MPAKTASPIPAQVLWQGRPIAYTISRSRRARKLRLRVNTAGVQLTLPQRVPLAEGKTFVEEQIAWIINELDRVRAMDARRATLAPPGTLLLRGRGVPFTVSRLTDVSRPDVKVYNDMLYISVPAASTLNNMETVLEAWLREEARRDVQARIAVHAGPMQVAPQRLYIYGQKTRWGSCSPRGNLSLNWRLIFAAPEILDYVVVHELAHLREMNHSPRFWAIVAEHCPDYKALRKWLLTEGHDLLHLSLMQMIAPRTVQNSNAEALLEL